MVVVVDTQHPLSLLLSGSLAGSELCKYVRSPPGSPPASLRVVVGLGLLLGFLCLQRCGSFASFVAVETWSWAIPSHSASRSRYKGSRHKQEPELCVWGQPTPKPGSAHRDWWFGTMGDATGGSACVGLGEGDAWLTAPHVPLRHPHVVVIAEQLSFLLSVAGFSIILENLAITPW